MSVCIITYNHERYIRQCLEGVVQQQTDFPFDVIIGEDCSTDRTRQIVQEFEARYPGIIKPIYHSKNVGGARNGYEFCYPRLTGKYVAICEGDDYWTDPFKLQKQVDYLERHEDHVMCFHRVESVDEHDRFIDGQTPSDRVVTYSGKQIFHISIPTLSVVFRKCFDVIPDEMFRARSGDTFLFGLLARYGKAADLGFVGARYRKHSGGVFSPKAVVEQFAQAIETRKLMKQCPLFADEQKKEISREIIKRKILYFKYFLKRYEPLNSFRIIIR